MKKIGWNLLLVLCVCVMAFSGWKLYQSYHAYKQAEDEYEKITKQAVTTASDGRSIDFETLKKINPEVIGWIYIKGTRIDYPVVKGNDNDEYLHKTFEGTMNNSGAIFMDKDGEKDFGGQQNIVYGHHMKNGSMFADLLKFREDSFIKKQNEILLYTPKKEIKLKVIAAYAKEASERVLISFGSEENRFKYIRQFMELSEIKNHLSEKEIGKIKKIYTFVTCSYEGEDYRTYVHAIESK